MFTKLCLFALVAPLVSGLQLQTPKNPTSGGEVTIQWINEQGDPDTWSFELINVAFNNAFAIANNVNPSASQLTLTLPIVPVGDGYTLQAVNIGNISDVFASTPDFAIGAATTTSSTAASTTTTSSSTGKVTTTSGTSKASITTTGTTSSPFSSVIVSPTAPASSTTSATSTTGGNAAITPSSAATSSRVNLGNSVGGFAVAILSAAAGMAMIVL